MTGGVFYLAIPAHHLDAALSFYRDVLGAATARRHADRRTLCFIAHQLVCHLDPHHQVLADPLARTYPRHFGCERCCEAKVTHLSELSWRFNDKPEHHRTLWTAGPAGNVREFKWFQEPRFVY